MVSIKNLTGIKFADNAPAYRQVGIERIYADMLIRIFVENSYFVASGDGIAFCHFRIDVQKGEENSHRHWTQDKSYGTENRDSPENA